MIPQHPHAVRHFFIVGHNRAGFAIRAKIFAGIETKTSNVAERADAPAFIFCAVGLSGVFNHKQVLASGKVEDWIQIRRLPIQMNRNERARSGSD